jgi:hypothetical protein
MRHVLTFLAASAIAWTSAASSADHVAMSGEDLYRRFCASCHGVEGRGDGPVAASFRVEVPDLTRTARRMQGAEGRERLIRIIDGRHIVGAHGTRIMPVWGEDLSRLEAGNPEAERASQLIIQRLADYVMGLQPTPQN